MDIIFHEKQEGSLCAQHCLNALLQANYFSPVSLAELGQTLDDQERQKMAEGGIQSDEYRRFLEQPSSNFDDSGFFSIQVLQAAVKVWNLDLIPLRSSDPMAVAAKEDPTTQQAYVCNFREHWFTVRKLGHQWFNLNSLLTGPELVSDTYLLMFLTQLESEGYSIFIVIGLLPPCQADEVLRLQRAEQPIKPRLLADSSKSHKADSSPSPEHDDPSLRRVLEESRRLIDDDDESLKRALALSMKTFEDECGSMDLSGAVASSSSAGTTLGSAATAASKTAGDPEDPAKPQNPEELRQKRLAFLGQDPEVSKDQSSANTKGQMDNSKEVSLDQPKDNNVPLLNHEKMHGDSCDPMADGFDDPRSCAISEEGSSQDSTSGDTTSSSKEDRSSTPVPKVSEMSEDEMLQLALSMSMQNT